MTSPSALAGVASSPFQPNAQATTQSSSSTNSSSSSDNSFDNPATFITLLTTQLQAQDPLDPMSPSEMVDQLTQINSLQQLMQIQDDLQSMLGVSTSTAQADARLADATQAAPQNSVSLTNPSPSSLTANNQ